MTATTSPGPTESPAATRISLTVPAFSALMAFSIFMASSTQTVWPDLDLVADGHEDLDDGALHGHGHRARPGPGRRGAAPWPAAPAAAPRRAGCRRATGDLGDPELHGVAAAVDLGGHLAQHPWLGRSPASAASAPRRRQSRGQGRQVEAVLDPAGRVLGLDEVGVLEDGDVGRDGGGHPGDLGLAERPQHPPAGRLAVVAPDDELGHQVVVVLADGVARS